MGASCLFGGEKRRGKKKHAKKKDDADEKEEAESKETQEVESAKEPEALAKPKSERKAGKQPGAKGHGRQVELAITGEEIHKATECAACGEMLCEETPFEKSTGLYVLDIERLENGGITLTHIRHIYGKSHCRCGHITEMCPQCCEPESGWDVGLSEWHLVGPTLSSLIICLSLRMRLSRMRIQEFLQEWLQITLSIGCINQCIHEGGRAVAPLEEEFVKEIQASELLHVDETGWKENGRLTWLWVLRTHMTTYYIMGGRSWKVIADVLEKFSGWLMSDGYHAYRNYGKRLRCLAHIIRKANGLAASSHPEAAEFGEKLLEQLKIFVKAIYAARGDPEEDLVERFSDELSQLKALCEQNRDAPQVKVKQLARELIHDWETIWNVLKHPELPMTNNVAERCLRHWVISRKISYGTRNAQGSRAYTLLASVIDTCRQRGVSPWPYIAEVIRMRRKGEVAPSLPLTAL